MSTACTDCGWAVEAQARFCVRCGAELVSDHRQHTLSRRLEPHKRLLSVMFCDLVGSTELAVRFGAERLRQLTIDFQRRVATVAKAHSGFVARYMGDGVLIYFGYPHAKETDVEHALRAGLEILQGHPEAAGEPGHGLRIGVATGLLIIGDVIGHGAAREHATTGEAVNLAARLQSVAAPGSMVVCGRTRELAGNLFAFAAVQASPLKGFADPVASWRVLGPTNMLSRFEALRAAKGLTPFTGRERDLGWLRAHVENPAAATTAIDIVGDPGVGKSRLIREFHQRGAAAPHLVFQAGCSPDARQTAYLPFKQLLQQVLSAGASRSSQALAEEVEQSLQTLGLGNTVDVALVCTLLDLPIAADALRGLDAVLLGLRTRDLLLEILRRCGQSRSGLLILVFEDLHWIDRASEALLERIIAGEAGSGLLVIHTRRPNTVLAWAGRPNVFRLELDPMDAQTTREVAQNRLGVRALPEPLATLIAEKAEGNPLFTEELITFLMQRGIIRQAPEGLLYNPGTAKLELPASIELLLTSRITTLSPDHRLLLHFAAVMGRRFDLSVLEALLDAGAAPEQSLAALETADLVYRTKQPGIYAFKHALVRDAMYSSLLADARASLHGLVADELERRNGGQLWEIAEELARHYEAAGEVQKAVTYLFLSGQKSLRAYSVDAAEDFFSRAIALVDSHRAEVPQQQAGALVAEALSLLGLQAKYIDATALFERYRTLLTGLAEPYPYVKALNATCFAYFMQTRFAQASELAREAMTVAATADDELCLVYAASALIYSESAHYGIPAGDIAALAGSVLAKAEAVDDGYIQVRLLFDLAFYYVIRGSFMEARVYAKQLAQVGLTRRDPRATCFAEWTLGLVCVAEGDAEAALARGEAALAASLMIWDRVGSLWVKTGALVAMRRREEAATNLAELRRLCEISNDRLSGGSAGLFVGALLILDGKVGRGLREIAATIRLWDKVSWPNYADWVRVNLAEVYIELLAPAARPSTLFVLRNILTLVYLRLVAARRATALLERNLQSRTIDPEGYMRARAHYDLGSVQTLRGLRTEARQNLEASRDGAIRLGEASLLERSERALQDLDPRPSSRRTFGKRAVRFARSISSRPNTRHS